MLSRSQKLKYEDEVIFPVVKISSITLENLSSLTASRKESFESINRDRAPVLNLHYLASKLSNRRIMFRHNELFSGP